jgi:two-component sensor histidine kinase
LKHLQSKPSSVFLVLLICLLFSLCNRSVAQDKTFLFTIKRNLLTINEEVIKSNFVPAVTCTIFPNSDVEDLFANALVYGREGNWQCCKNILNSVFEQRVKLTAVQACHFHLAWANYFTLRQNYDSAYFYANIAVKEAQEQKWNNEKAEALLLLSSGNLKQRNISFAYSCADSALIIARQTGNDNLEGKTLLQLALCARRHFTAVAKRSFPYFLMAREKTIAAADSLTLGTIDLYMSTDYFELDKWAEGLPYFKEGIMISLHNKNLNQRYLAYSALGYAFELTKNFREALLLFFKALELSQLQQQPYNTQHSYHDISRCYQGLHQFDSALVYANLAGDVAGVDPYYANVWDIKAAIYDNMGDYKMAAGMYKRSIDWFREDFLYRNQDQLSGYEAKLNTKEKELAVTQEKKHALELEWMIGAVGGLLIIAAWAFVVQRKARHKLFLQNNLIQSQRSALEKSLGEKEILLKEIHHRVKNNLSVISSLLELQSSGINDEAARAAIAVGQNRIASIALIHQRLYQHENLADIELYGFIQDLSKQVSSIFKKPQTQIKIEIDVPETLLDIDTAVPLGLIMNELLTNSYKYAFENNNGQIKIDLQQPSPGEFLLTYADNGPGISEEINIKKSTSLGLRLITRLSKQIGGKATYRYRNGSAFIINFKNSNSRNKE